MKNRTTRRLNKRKQRGGMMYEELPNCISHANYEQLLMSNSDAAKHYNPNCFHKKLRQHVNNAVNVNNKTVLANNPVNINQYKTLLTSNPANVNNKTLLTSNPVNVNHKTVLVNSPVKANRPLTPNIFVNTPVKPNNVVNRSVKANKNSK